MMMKGMILILAMISFACTTQNPQSVEKESVKVINVSNNPFNKLQKMEEELIKAPYKLTLDIQQSIDNNLDLIVNIEVEAGAFFASPFDNDHLRGHFKISLGEEKNLSMTDLLTETPVSKAVIDQYSNRPTRWVKENTTYVQTLKLNTDKDFEVFGNIKFVIELQCTLEEISFKITKKDGKVSIERNPDC